MTACSAHRSVKCADLVAVRSVGRVRAGTAVDPRGCCTNGHVGHQRM